MRFKSRASSKVKTTDFTSMIDVVFLLLVFFVMTFKVVSLEGDFNIRADEEPSTVAVGPEETPPIQLRLKADVAGKLTEIRMNDQRLTDFAELRQKVVRLVESYPSPKLAAEDLEVVLKTDYDLKYEYIIQAITAVSGQKDEDGEVQPLISKVRFSH